VDLVLPAILVVAFGGALVSALLTLAAQSVGDDREPRRLEESRDRDGS
jgi:hypothetical protein